MGEQTFVVGQRVLFQFTKPLPHGAKAGLGTVTFIDENGRVRVQWDDSFEATYHPGYLNPAEPPPAQPDDEQVRAIRERLAKYDRFVSTEGDTTSMELIFGDDIRYLLARLDAVQAERDALQAILKPIAALYEQYLEADLDEMSSDMFTDWLDDGEVQGRVHKAMSAAFRIIGYQHKKESDDANA